MADTFEPWSTTRSDHPVNLPEDLAAKNTRILNPLAAPDLYYEFYDHSAAEVKVTSKETGETTTYELVKNINDPDSGFHAKIIKDPETGHHILLAKGMDMPGRDEGAGNLGFMDDIGDLKNQSLQTCISDQVMVAENAYLDLLKDPEVKSLEVIGYSVGAIPANYYASVYGAKVTNIADLGVPGTEIDGHTSTQQFIAGAATKLGFNWCSNGFFPGVHGDFKTNLESNVVGLELRLDVMGGPLGAVGERYGTRIVLDEDHLNTLGSAHIPDVYAKSAREEFDAPETETVKTFEGDTWKPFN